MGVELKIHDVEWFLEMRDSSWILEGRRGVKDFEKMLEIFFVHRV